MNNPLPSNELRTLDLTRLGHATRFAIACVALGISWVAINSCLNIPQFARIFSHMLGENAPLPLLTRFVLNAYMVLLVLSFCVPVGAIALLFARDVVRSLYCLGILILVAIVECIVVAHAKYAPLITFIEEIQGGGP